jgi:hypothetical protein
MPCLITNLRSLTIDLVLGAFGGEVVSALAFHAPLRPQVQASVRTFSMRLEPSLHVKRVKVNALPKVVGHEVQEGWAEKNSF